MQERLIEMRYQLRQKMLQYAAFQGIMEYADDPAAAAAAAAAALYIHAGA